MYIKTGTWSHKQWLTPIIIAAQEVEIGKIMV
jgi:hypothetical protein